MATDNVQLPIRGTKAERARLAQAADELTKRNQAEGRPGKVSLSDVGILAVRRYLKELEEQGILPPDLGPSPQ